MPDDHLSLLEQAVASLSQYFVGDETLNVTLHRVAELSMLALPQVTHVGITLLVNGRPDTAVFTHPEVPEIDQAQYRTGNGPCLDAFRNGVPYVIDSTLETGDWQDFRDSAARHGVLSSMSLPLIAHAGPIGALNMYAGAERAFAGADRGRQRLRLPGGLRAGQRPGLLGCPNAQREHGPSDAVTSDDRTGQGHHHGHVRMQRGRGDGPAGAAVAASEREAPRHRPGDRRQHHARRSQERHMGIDSSAW